MKFVKMKFVIDDGMAWLESHQPHIDERHSEANVKSDL